MLKLISIIIALVFIVLGVVLGLLNPHPVKFDGYFFQAEWPLSLLLAGAFMLGLILGALFLLSQVVALKWQMMKLRRNLKKKEAEIVKLNISQVEAKSSEPSDNALPPETPELTSKASQ